MPNCDSLLVLCSYFILVWRNTDRRFISISLPFKKDLKLLSNQPPFKGQNNRICLFLLQVEVHKCYDKEKIDGFSLWRSTAEAPLCSQCRNMFSQLSNKGNFFKEAFISPPTSIIKLEM